MFPLSGVLPADLWICRSNTNVTPFSAELPVLERVEIGDVAIAYDDPISLVTYLLVMKNALLIPSMSHSLLPPFLIREASLFLDETPKFQSTDLSLDYWTIILYMMKRQG